jgi:hypothetical protein
MSIHTRLRLLGPVATTLSVGAVALLFAGTQGFVGVPKTSAQIPYTAPMVVSPSIPSPPSVPMPAVSLTTGPAPAELGTAYYGPPSEAIDPGQYCSDKTGGQIYVPAGAPPEPGLTCPAVTMTPAAPSASASATATPRATATPSSGGGGGGGAPSSGGGY